MFQRVEPAALWRLQNEFSARIPAEQFTEMALPWYLRWIPLILRLVWRRNERNVAALLEPLPRAVLAFGSGFGVLLTALCTIAGDLARAGYQCKPFDVLPSSPVPLFRLFVAKPR